MELAETSPQALPRYKPGANKDAKCIFITQMSQSGNIVKTATLTNAHRSGKPRVKNESNREQSGRGLFRYATFQM